MKVETFFDHLWQDYITVTPQADVVHKAILEKNDNIINDHVAFRTFNLPKVNLEVMEKHLLDMGYTRKEEYHFEAKKLRAWGYMPPEEGQPLVFLSELLVEQLSEASQAIIKKLVDQIDPETMAKPEVFWAGRLWDVPSYEDYRTLADESEYAGWMSVMGYRANHFTVSVNHLNNTETLEDVLDLVASTGTKLNESGGLIKGSKDVFLAQGSTMADKMTLTFADGDEHEVPTCFYEFAQRFELPNGDMFMGFVAASADKIFESTDSK